MLIHLNLNVNVLAAIVLAVLLVKYALGKRRG